MDQRTQLVIAYMRGNLHCKLSLSDLARVVNLSRSRMRHLFKAETGTSPARYLHSLRIEQAKELLEVTTLSVAQIMIRVGVRDRSYFDREFKKAYGLTPIQYRIAVQLTGSVNRS